MVSQHFQPLTETSPTVQTYLMTLFVLTTHPSSTPVLALINFLIFNKNICYIHRLILYKSLYSASSNVLPSKCLSSWWFPTVLFLLPISSSQSIFFFHSLLWDRNLSQRPWKTEATSLDSGEAGGAWSETQCPSPPSSEAARKSRWDAGARCQRWCVCLHAAPLTTAQGCDSGRKTCSGLTWDMLGIGKIFSEEHMKSGSQSAVLSRLLTWLIMGVLRMWQKVQLPLTQRQHLVYMQFHTVW